MLKRYGEGGLPEPYNPEILKLSGLAFGVGHRSRI